MRVCVFVCVCVFVFLCMYVWCCDLNELSKYVLGAGVGIICSCDYSCSDHKSRGSLRVSFRLTPNMSQHSVTLSRLE